MPHDRQAFDIFKDLRQNCSQPDIAITLRGGAIQGNPQDIQTGIDQFP